MLKRMMTKYITRIEKTGMKFCASHFLTEEFGKCFRLHGHDYIINVSVRGSIQDSGVVIDFSILKKVIKRVILPMAHKILIPALDGPYTVREDPEKPDHLLIAKDGNIKYRFPKKLTFSIPTNSVTAENICIYLYKHLKQQSELRAYEIRIELSETPNNHAAYGDF